MTKNRLQNRSVFYVKMNSLFKRNSLVIIFFGVIIAGHLLSPTFLKMANIQNVMRDVSILGMLALGQTLVMLVKEIDLSVGSSLAFSPTLSVALSSFIMSLFGQNIIKGSNYVVSGLTVFIIITLAVGFTIGLINGLIRIKAKIPSLIVTLGMLYTLGGFTYILFDGYSLYLTRLEGAQFLGSYTVVNIPISFVIYLSFAAIFVFLLNKTKLGNRIYATGGNEKAAIYSGINTDKWKLFAFCISGICVGLASLFYSSRLETIEPTQGKGYELISIAIAVIGGTTLEGGKGTIWGTFIGSLILVLLLNILSLLGFVSWYKTIFIGMIIIAAAYKHSVQSRKLRANL